MPHIFSIFLELILPQLPQREQIRSGYVNPVYSTCAYFFLPIFIPIPPLCAFPKIFGPPQLLLHRIRSGFKMRALRHDIRSGFEIRALRHDILPNIKFHKDPITPLQVKNTSFF